MNPAAPPEKPVAYVVDDEPMLLDLNEEILQSIGFDVQRFRAAEQALRAYQATTRRPAIIVTDYAMHQMSGLDLVSACRHINPDQKLIIVSGTVDESEFQDAPEKPDCFLAKPYDPNDLTSAVRDLTGFGK
jgi:DNA-binding NtrC family response regulator